MTQTTGSVTYFEQVNLNQWVEDLQDTGKAKDD